MTGVSIQEINELISQINVTVCHTLREGNQCVDVMVKLEASSNKKFLLHSSAPDNLPRLLKIDQLFFLSCHFLFAVFVFY